MGLGTKIRDALHSDRRERASYEKNSPPGTFPSESETAIGNRYADDGSYDERDYAPGGNTAANRPDKIVGAAPTKTRGRGHDRVDSGVDFDEVDPYDDRAAQTHTAGMGSRNHRDAEHAPVTSSSQRVNMSNDPYWGNIDNSSYHSNNKNTNSADLNNKSHPLRPSAVGDGFRDSESSYGNRVGSTDYRETNPNSARHNTVPGAGNRHHQGQTPLSPSLPDNPQDFGKANDTHQHVRDMGCGRPAQTVGPGFVGAASARETAERHHEADLRESGYSNSSGRDTNGATASGGRGYDNQTWERERNPNPNPNPVAVGGYPAGPTHYGPAHEGARVVHTCVNCGYDNDISQYFKKDAVYRLGGK